MKRLMVLLLVLLPLIMVECGINVAYSEEKQSEDGVFFYIVQDDGTAMITGAQNASHLEIPAVLDGYVVTCIGDGAFNACYSLTSITIPDGVTSIGDGAFQACESLTSITIPDGVTSIGDVAFNACYSLTSITIPDGVTSIGDGAFQACHSLTSITIPDGVISMGDYVFQSCHSLTSISIPNSVTSIGYAAFSNCSSLTSIIIPDSVVTIGSSAFRGCYALDTIQLSSEHPTLELVEGALLDKINKCLISFFNRAATTYAIPDGVTYIGHDAFYGCSSLNSITIPNSVMRINESAFSNCSSLTSITIPDSVTIIASRAFEWCSSLTNIIIPDSVTFIGTYAFCGCSGLTSITIPDTVTSMGSGVFDNCSIDLTFTVNENSCANQCLLNDGIDPARICYLQPGNYADATVLVDVQYGIHPHYERTEVYADGHTVVVQNENGCKLSRELCDKCYPVEFNADTLMEMAKLAMAAYETRDMDPSEYPEHLKDAVRFNDIDCLVIPELTDDGKMCLTISFEGSKEIFDDWLADFLAGSNKYGMHTGLAHDFGRLISEHANELLPLLNQVRNTGGSIQITGHSLGGGLTQLMAYWLLTEYDFPIEKLTAYTFASPVVLSYEALQDERIQGAHVYNIININDEVPDVGITGGIPVINTISETVDNLFANATLDGGITKDGCNIGKNFYLSDGSIDLPFVDLFDIKVPNWIVQNHRAAQWLAEDMLSAVQGEEIDFTEIDTSEVFLSDSEHAMKKYLELLHMAISGEVRGYALSIEELVSVNDMDRVWYYDDEIAYPGAGDATEIPEDYESDEGIYIWNYDDESVYPGAGDVTVLPYRRSVQYYGEQLSFYEWILEK